MWTRPAGSCLGLASQNIADCDAVRAAIRRQCQAWQAGTFRGVIRNGRDPQWVRWNGVEFELIEERAAERGGLGAFLKLALGAALPHIVRQFALALRGVGFQPSDLRTDKGKTLAIYEPVNGHPAPRRMLNGHFLCDPVAVLFNAALEFRLDVWAEFGGVDAGIVFRARRGGAELAF